MSPNLTAFLALIRACEGTNTPDGYRALFGYRPGNAKTFPSFSWHPNIRQPFTQTNGIVNYTTAAGAYQFLHGTWIDLATALSLDDFGPENQDIAAVELIRRQGALSAIEAGDLQHAINRCATIWASLPASRYPQPKRTYEFAEAAYVAAGGAVA